MHHRNRSNGTEQVMTTTGLKSTNTH